MIFGKRNKNTLEYILVELTQKCNLKCGYCYNHWKNDTCSVPHQIEGYDYSIKLLKKLFRESAIKHVTFTGGEPLLAERLPELVLFCRMKGATVSIITNGNAGSLNDFSELIRLGVQLFELPLHSHDPKIHDRMTGVIGSWNKSLETIKYIKNMGGYVVPVIVITRYNFHTMAETLELLHSMGFRRIMINRYNYGGVNALTPENISAGKAELNEAFVRADKTAASLRMEVSSNVCTPHCIVDPVKYRSIRFTNCSPDLKHRPLTISLKGDLRFCNHSTTVLGNIFTQSVKTILDEGQNRIGHEQVPSFCEDCTRFEKCMGGCRAAAEQTGKTFNDVDPIAHLEINNKPFKTA
jgi:radical SAM protein with 4Fe4S-binding SPASM domain